MGMTSGEPASWRPKAFVAKLDEPQATVAREMLEANVPIETFWGPEQMDVWRLDLRRGSVLVRFGIERGFSYGIEIDHPRLRRRSPGENLTPYIAAWMVAAWRTGALSRAFDPAAPNATSDPTAWAMVVDWMNSQATQADFDAIDNLRDLIRSFLQMGYRMTHPLSEAERISRVESILNRV
jgi:hypothetical protein